MARTAQIETDVTIVGAGIAGAALACALRNSGLSILLLEKSAGPLDTARGDHLQPGTVEILERWGVLDDFFANGAEKRLGSVWYSADGETLLHSSCAELDIPHPYYLYLNHEMIGNTLLKRALCDSRVSLARPIRNWWLEGRSAEGVTFRVGYSDGDDVTVTTRLIVGADGRNSRVRKVFGVHADLHRYQRPIAVMFARPAEREPENNLKAYLSDRQLVAVIPRTGGNCKIGVPIEPREIPAWRRANAERLKAKLNALVPRLIVEDVRFADVYPPVYLRARAWIADKVVLIGDACHAMHPARSQGMNIAIRCVDALAGALRESAGALDAPTTDRILTGYEASLKPAIEAMLERNHRHGLEMDRSGRDHYAVSCETLRSVQSNPDARHAFALNAAGYASPETAHA